MANLEPNTCITHGLVRPRKHKDYGFEFYICPRCLDELNLINVLHYECPKCKKKYQGPPLHKIVFSERKLIHQPAGYMETLRTRKIYCPKKHLLGK